MPLLLVAGPHRSGSSAMTKVLELLGADIGRPEEHLPPSDDNPLGFFEPRDVVQIDKEILAAFKGSWDRPPHLPPDWVDDPRIDHLRERAASFLTTRDLRGHVAVKDPRLSLTAPLWRGIAPRSRVVVCLRDPLASARSLRRRNGIDLERGCELWLRYTLEPLVAEPDALVLAYEEVLTRPDELARRTASELGLPEPDAEVLEGVRSWARPDLDHGADGGEVLGPWARTACRVHRQLVDGAATPSAMVDPFLVEHLRARSWQASGTERYEEELARTRRALEKAETVRVRAEAAVGVVKGERERTVAELRRAEAARSDLETELATLRAAHAHVRRRLEVTDAELAVARQRTQAVEAQLQKERRAHARLARRRSVRAALRLASAWRPLFRLARRVRSG
ncbi:MAG: hypothetical protein ACLGIR_13035 [Actinomycetes bacterium]